MDYAAIIKQVGRGKNGATDLDQDTARALYGDMLDGKLPELELGALLLAFRIKGESTAEILGFHQALQQRIAQLRAPADKPLPIIIPSYNGARRQANLTALLALLLLREGLPVLVHGPLTDVKRVTTAQIFAELNILQCTTLEQAQARIDAGELAWMTPALLSPGLAHLLELRWRLGVRNSIHTLAKLADPFTGKSLKLVSVTHPDYIDRMSSFFSTTKLSAILMRGTEGEVYANPKRCPQLEFFIQGERRLLVEAEQGSVTALPDLPQSMEASVTAAWIKQVLVGTRPVPPPILKQVQCCLMAATTIKSDSG